MSVCAKRDPKSPSQTKVRQLQVTISINEEVLRLEVSMKDPVGMAEPDPLHQLAHELFHDRASKAVSSRLSTFGYMFHALLPIHFHVLLEVHVKELEDEVELMSIGMNNVQETDYGRVLHFFEK